jgi:hypothetical protein
MRLFDQFVNAAERCGYLDSATKEGDTYTLKLGNEALWIKEHFDNGKLDGVLIRSSRSPRALQEVKGSGIDRYLPRFIAQHFTGVSKKGTVFEPTGKIISNFVEFVDGRGRNWLCSSSNVPEITLALYKDLNDATADHSLVLLPGLYSKSRVKIGSSVEGKKEEVKPDMLVSSVEDFKRYVPNLDEYKLMPRFVPEVGVALVSGMVSSSADRSVFSASRPQERWAGSKFIMNEFLDGSLTFQQAVEKLQGYTGEPRKSVEAEVQRWDSWFKGNQLNTRDYAGGF